MWQQAERWSIESTLYMTIMYNAQLIVAAPNVHS